MESILAMFMAALEPLRVLALRAYELLPSLMVGLVVLIAGVFLAGLVRRIVMRVLNVIRLDHHLGRIGLADALGRLGLGRSLSRLIGVVIHAIMIIGFIVAAANAVGLGIVSDYVGRTLSFVPLFISLMIVLGGGLFLGDVAGRIVHDAAHANHVRGADILSRIGHGLIIIFSGVIAFELIGIDFLGLIREHMRIVVGTIGLGLAIAFGIAMGHAARDMAGRLLRNVTPDHTKMTVLGRRGRKAA